VIEAIVQGVDMKTAIFQYRCRLCGKVYDDSCTNENHAQQILVAVVHGYTMPEILIGQPLALISCHAGCEMGHGVSDLIGYVVKYL